MKYTVTGPAATFGAGHQLRLTASQIDARRPFIHIDDADKGKVTALDILNVQKRGRNRPSGKA